MSLIRASIWLSLSELIFNLSGYLIHAVLGRVLGPAEYGRYGLIVTFSTMIVVLLSRGIPIAMSKYLGETGGKKSRLADILLIRNTGWKTQIAVIAVITLAYYLLAPFFAWIVRDPSLTPLIRLSTLIVPAFSLATFYVYYFVGIQQFTKQAFLKISRALLKVFLIIAGAIWMATPGAILGHALAPFLIFIIGYFTDPYRKIKQTNLSQPIIRLDWKKMFVFAGPITFFMIFYEVMITADIYMVKGILRNDTLTGYYNGALNIGRLPYNAFYFLTLILLPKISEVTTAGAKQAASRLLRKTMRFVFMLLFPTIALLSAWAPALVNFLYGEQFISAARPLCFLALGMGFYTIFYILAFVLNGAGKNKTPMVSACIGMILNIVLSFFLIKKYSLVGAAWANNISAGIIMLWTIYVTEKTVASFICLKSLLKYFVLSSGLWLIVTFWMPQGKFIFIPWTIALTALYFFLLYLWKELSADDWQWLLNAFKQKKTNKK